MKTQSLQEKQAYTKGWPFTWNGEELTDAEYGSNTFANF